MSLYCILNWKKAFCFVLGYILLYGRECDEVVRDFNFRFSSVLFKNCWI